MKLSVIYEEANAEHIITKVIKYMTNYYRDEVGMDACKINTGECMHFADGVWEILKKEYGIDTDVIAEAHFYDAFGDYEEHEMADPREYNSPPTFDYKKHGLPSHYWIYHNGKHYDSEAPQGVNNFFHLPIMIKYKEKYNL